MIDATIVAETPDELCADLGGNVYGDGVYRIMAEADRSNARGYLELAHPDIVAQLDPFASDWLGRIFSLRSTDKVVILAEPGTAQVLTIPLNLPDFHNLELRDYADAAVADQFFAQWRAAGGSTPAIDECVSYRKPLFLGGSDTVDNLEISDLDVYWTITGQVVARLKQERTAS